LGDMVLWMPERFLRLGDMVLWIGAAPA
jgi:hypothetical protein